MGSRAIGLLASALALLHGAAEAQFSSPGEQQTSQCVLQYTTDTRSAAAVQMIHNACRDLYDPIGLSTNTRQLYDNCLLQHLSGAQSDAAAAQIEVACNNMFPRF